ncbi:MAG: hypothetical protein JWP89_5154 [Schlesneria sp.]|nr:hypothetical protein [Schlesneria sp.]
MFHALVLINLLCFDGHQAQMIGAPLANVITPPRHCATATDPQVATVRTLMSRWEAVATRNTVPWRAEREILRFHVTSHFNGHAATAMGTFLGQIDARQLRESHDWQIVETANWETCLEAIPKDETERLFYGSIRVWLNTASAQLVRMQAFDRHGEPTAHWSAPETNDLAAVLPGVLGDDGIPPTPPVDKFGRPIRQVVQNEKERGSHQGVPVLFRPMPAVKNKRILLASARLNGTPPYADHADLEGPPDDPRGERHDAVTGGSAKGVLNTPDAIDAILKNWQTASMLNSNTKVQFNRTVYNLASEEELTSNAELTYDARGKVKLVIRHGDFNRRQTPTGKRIGKSGQPFTINHDRACSFISTKHEIIQTDDDDKSYQIIASLEMGGVPLVEFQLLSRYWLPFLLDIQPAELVRDWSFSQRGSTGKSVILVATPRTETCKSFLAECWIVIDATTWQTSAVKYFDADGTTETVYKVDHRSTNTRSLKNDFEIDLKNYRLIITDSWDFTPPQPKR